MLNWPVNGLALPGGRVLLEGTKGRPSYSGPATLEHAAITAGLDAGSIRSSASSCLNVKDLRLAMRTEIIHGSGVPDYRTLEYPDCGACRGDDMKPFDSPGGPVELFRKLGAYPSPDIIRFVTWHDSATDPRRF